eukprot:gene1370-11992_t
MEGKQEVKHGLRPSDQIIARIRWDKKFDSTKLLIGYLDRFVGPMECTLTTFDEGDIPMHRIIYLKYVEEIIWDREKKIDKLTFSVGEEDFNKPEETEKPQEEEKPKKPKFHKKQPKPSENEKEFEDDWSSDDEEELKALQNKI